MRFFLASRDLLRGAICLAPSLGFDEQTTQDIAWMLMMVSYLNVFAELMRTPAANEPRGHGLKRMIEPAMEIISTHILMRPSVLKDFLEDKTIRHSNQIIRVFNINMMYQAYLYFGINSSSFQIPLMSTLTNVSFIRKIIPTQIPKLATGIFSLYRGITKLPEVIRTMPQSLFMASL